MDVIVKAPVDGREWRLTDLLGRSMGHIEQATPNAFTIHPDGGAVETMLGIEPGPFPTLDAALAEIERHTRGTCRRSPGEDAP